MELEHTNPNSEIVLESELKYEQLFLRKIANTKFIMDPIHYFFKNLLRLPTNQEAS